MLKQFTYLVRASEAAQRKGANQSAAEFLDNAARVAMQLQLSPSELSEVERLRGEAYLALGNRNERVFHMKGALKLLGCPHPTDRRLLLACSSAAAIQALHLVWLGTTSGSKEASNHQLKIAQAYLRVGLYNYFTGHSLPALHAALNCLNYAERAGTTAPVLAEAYANMAIAANTFSNEPVNLVSRS